MISASIASEFECLFLINDATVRHLGLLEFILSATNSSFNYELNDFRNKLQTVDFGRTHIHTFEIQLGHFITQ